MLNTHLIDGLAKMIVNERVDEQRLARAIRKQRAKRIAQRNLYRGIEQALRADGGVAIVREALERLAPAESLPKTSCRA